MLTAKQLRERARTREYLRNQRATSSILKEARKLARSGRFADHREIARELDRLPQFERAQDWFGRFEVPAQLDELCDAARSRLMPTGPKGQKRPADVVGNAIKVARIATGEEEEEFEAPPPKNEAAAELGRKGGAARAAKMDPERRAEIARKAAVTRWKTGKD